MARTRSNSATKAGVGGQGAAEQQHATPQHAAAAPRQHTRSRSSSSGGSAYNIPTSAEQEQQLQSDRQKLGEYRRDWQESKGLGHTACRCVCCRRSGCGCDVRACARA
jgi:hypothetical protein